MNVLDTIKNLRDELNQHNYSYYVLDKPFVQFLKSAIESIYGFLSRCNISVQYKIGIRTNKK